MLTVFDVVVFFAICGLWVLTEALGSYYTSDKVNEKENSSSCLFQLSLLIKGFHISLASLIIAGIFGL